MCSGFMVRNENFLNQFHGRYLPIRGLLTCEGIIVTPTPPSPGVMVLLSGVIEVDINGGFIGEGKEFCFYHMVRLSSTNSNDLFFRDYGFPVRYQSAGCNYSRVENWRDTFLGFCQKSASRTGIC